MRHSTRGPVRAIALSINIESLTDNMAEAIREGWPKAWERPTIIVFVEREPVILPNPSTSPSFAAEEDRKTLADNKANQTAERIRKSFAEFIVEVRVVEPAPQPLSGVSALDLGTLSVYGSRFSIQDEFALTYPEPDVTKVHVSEERKIRKWESFPGYYRVQKPDICFTGGDLLVLDNAVLIGATASTYQLRTPPLAIESALQEHLVPLATPGIKMSAETDQPEDETSACNERVPGVNLRVVMGKVGKSLEYPFYHLDLYLTAMELSMEIVFFLGQLEPTKRFSNCASDYMRQLASGMEAMLEATIPVLEALATKTGKKITVERLPILLGKPYEGVHSFTNGLLIHEGEIGVYLTTVPDFSDLSVYWLSMEEVEAALQKTRTTMNQYGIQVYPIKAEPPNANAIKGGLHCVTKLL